MRFFLISILLFSFYKAWEGFACPKKSIVYTGMTLECTEGCGGSDDPDMEEIWSILDRTVCKIFRDVPVLDETGESKLLSSPLLCEDGICDIWDRKKTNGIWPSDESSICYYQIDATQYSNFLETARILREEMHFYYFTSPRKIHEHETHLIAQLEEGLSQGYNIYRILPGGKVAFDHRNLLYDAPEGWNWIDFKLNYLAYYGWSESEQDKLYTKAKKKVERSLVDIDALFRDIFVYCLKNHQPEGIAFSTAVESLLAGNLTEGIERIRKLIEIGNQFSSEILAKMHLLKGQLEIESALYADAVISLTEAIVKNPDLTETYLERATAYFELGEYEHSLEDYLAYTTRIESADPFSIQTFTLAFAKHLIPGCCESGKGLYLLLADLVRHPIHTARLTWEALSLLSNLAVTNEWKQLSETLAPEIHQLVLEWDSLSSEKRGELAGYAFGKYGTNLLIPSALTKAVAGGLKCKAQVSAAYKNLRAANQALLLEAATTLESAATIETAVIAAQETALLGEELGLTGSKMGQLKQAGRLEATLTGHHASLSPPMQESLTLHKTAQTFLKPHIKKPMPETQIRELIQKTYIPTFPRPAGIPEDYLVMLSDKGAGMKYVHPTNPDIYVRVMPGKPHSPFPYQQKPYVVQRAGKESINKYGMRVLNDSPEAHMPVEEFIYKDIQ